MFENSLENVVIDKLLAPPRLRSPQAVRRAQLDKLGVVMPLPVLMPPPVVDLIKNRRTVGGVRTMYKPLEEQQRYNLEAVVI